MTDTGFGLCLKSGFKKIVLTQELILVFNWVSRKHCLHQFSLYLLGQYRHWLGTAKYYNNIRQYLQKNTLILPDIRKYWSISTKIGQNLVLFNVTIMVSVKTFRLSLNGYAHGVDIRVGSCNYTVTDWSRSLLSIPGALGYYFLDNFG